MLQLFRNDWYDRGVPPPPQWQTPGAPTDDSGMVDDAVDPWQFASGRAALQHYTGDADKFVDIGVFLALTTFWVTTLLFVTIRLVLFLLIELMMMPFFIFPYIVYTILSLSPFPDRPSPQSSSPRHTKPL